MNAAASKLTAGGGGPPAQTVYTVIAEWARHAATARLAAWAIAGCSASAIAAVFGPARWVASLPLMAGAVGVWGLAERRGLRAVQVIALIAGTAAAIVAFYGVLIVVLGPSWKL